MRTNAEQTSSQQTSRGQVLVIISSEHTLTLQNNKTYPTGYFLNELTVPVRTLMDNGYSIVFANPKGNEPSSDINSETPYYFGGSETKCQDYKRFRDSLANLKNPIKTLDAVAGGLDRFDAIFFPGGHAPMIDLTSDPGVREILTYFHQNSLPTSLICHGPVSLLGALPNSREVVTALRSGDVAAARELAKNWIYADYNMTVYSAAEEQETEFSRLGGKVPFYPEVALNEAGGIMHEARPWASYALRDRELITGQNPFSDEAFSKLLLEALEEKRRKKAI
jgi:putative intracellular protease/amidase